MNPTTPGLAPYSQEWLDACATEVRLQDRRLVLAICQAFDLGTSWMPNALARILQEEEYMRDMDRALAMDSSPIPDLDFHPDEPPPVMDVEFTNERADYNATFLEARRG